MLKVLGNIDSESYEISQNFISMWACKAFIHMPNFVCSQCVTVTHMSEWVWSSAQCLDEDRSGGKMLRRVSCPPQWKQKERKKEKTLKMDSFSSFIPVKSVSFCPQSVKRFSFIRIFELPVQYEFGMCLVLLRNSCSSFAICLWARRLIWSWACCDCQKSFGNTAVMLH